jgi:hypothetical protein
MDVMASVMASVMDETLVGDGCDGCDGLFQQTRLGDLTCLTRSGSLVTSSGLCLELCLKVSKVLTTCKGFRVWLSLGQIQQNPEGTGFEGLWVA